jgi:hypothetical protein
MLGTRIIALLVKLRAKSQSLRTWSHRVYQHLVDLVIEVMVVGLKPIVEHCLLAFFDIHRSLI